MEQKQTRTASNRVAVEWGILEFSSYKLLDDHLGVRHGYSRVYWENNGLLKGHKVLRKDGKKSDYKPTIEKQEAAINLKLWAGDDELKAWYRFVICRPGMITEIGIDEMLKKFKISIGRK